MSEHEETTAETTMCRARVADDCEQGHGRDPEAPMREDSTHNGHTIVCNACYLLVQPFMRMNQEYIPGAADDAVHHYKTQKAFLEQHDNPQELVDEAAGERKRARQGSPRWISANALHSMAIAEVERRKNA